VLRLHDANVAVHPFLGDAFEQNGDLAKAMAEYSAALPAYPAYAKARIAHLRAVMGKRSEALQLLRELEHPAAGEPPPNSYDVATVYAALGDRDSVFHWLNLAYEQRNVALLKVDPFLDPVRNDPRFAELLKRAGLAS
jgi:tetratricopeptide (TPR) repeat protein